MNKPKDENLTNKQLKKSQKNELKKQKYLEKYGVSIDEVNSALAKKRQGKSESKRLENNGKATNNNSSKNAKKT